MSTETATYDVFLSFSLPDGQLADQVASGLSEAGLYVFSPSKIQAGTNFRDEIWDALAESAALVVVINPDNAPSASTAVELGAAMAWRKPIYLVHTGKGHGKVPAYLAEARAYSISRLDDLAVAIARDRQAMSDSERSTLASIYSEFGVPTDRLLQQPGKLDKFAREYADRTGRNVPGERLMQELLRLRKSKGLPRLAPTRDD